MHLSRFQNSAVFPVDLMKKIKNILVVCKHQSDSKEAESCRILFEKNLKIRYAWKNHFEEKDLQDTDLVISIGGDGTALSASHFLKNTPLLAVNSSPKTSEGALTTISLNQLKQKLKQIELGEYEIEKLGRIEVEINKKTQDLLALNEVFLANKNAYKTSKYILRIKQGKKLIKEKQKSSGLIIATGTGSTAWFRSAGGNSFPANSEYLKLLVREPYIRKLNAFSQFRATLHKNDWTEIKPRTRMVLAIDSIREFQLSPANKIKIKLSKHPLLRIR